jgi:hypothetical protein
MHIDHQWMISTLELSTQWYDGEGIDDLIGGGVGFDYWEMKCLYPQTCVVPHRLSSGYSMGF